MLTIYCAEEHVKMHEASCKAELKTVAISKSSVSVKRMSDPD